MKCPNKSHPLWKDLVNSIGETNAYIAYQENSYEIPDYSDSQVYDLIEENLSKEDAIRTIFSEQMSDENNMLEDRVYEDLKPFIPVTSDNFRELDVDKPTERSIDQSKQFFLESRTRMNERKYDKNRAIDFLESRFPEADVEFFEAVENIGSEVAHGYFKNASFHIWNHAEVGTEYHEAFHGLTQMYLNEDQLSDLYDEASEHYGIDRLNELALEESMAEDFRDYMLVGEEATIPQKILRFFKNLYNYIRTLVTDTVTMDQAFSMLDTGRIPPKFRRNMERYRPELTLYSSRPAMSSDMKKDVVDGVWSVYNQVASEAGEKLTVNQQFEAVQEYFASHAYSQPVGEDKYDAIPAHEAFDLIQKKFDESVTEEQYQQLLEDKGYMEIPSDKALENLVVLREEQLSEMQEDIHASYIDIAYNWETVPAEIDGNFTSLGWKDIFIESLPEYGFEYVPHTEEVHMHDDVQERIFDQSSLQESMRDKLSRGTKLFLHNINDGTYTDLGLPRKKDFAEVYADVLTTVADSQIFSEMYTKLETAGEFKQYIHDYLLPKLSELSDNKKAEFHRNMAQSYNTMLIEKDYYNKSGKVVRFFESNQNKRATRVLNKWMGQAFHSSADADGRNLYVKQFDDSDVSLSLNEHKVKPLQDSFRKLMKTANENPNTLSDDDIQNFSTFVKNLGLFPNQDITHWLKAHFKEGITKRGTLFTEGDLLNYYMISSNNNNNSSLSTIAKHIFRKDTVPSTRNIDSAEMTPRENPNNIFKVSETKMVLNRLSEIQAKFETQTTESHLDSQGNSTYPYNMRTQLHDSFRKLKNGEYYNEDFLSDPIYNPLKHEQYSALFARLQDNGAFREIFNWADYDGRKSANSDSNAITYGDQAYTHSYTTRMNAFLNNGNRETTRISVPTQADRDKFTLFEVPRISSLNKYLSGDPKTKTFDGIVKNELYSQIAKIQHNAEFIENHSKEFWIENYHFKYDKNGAMRTSMGNAFKVTSIFPDQATPDIFKNINLDAYINESDSLPQADVEAMDVAVEQYVQSMDEYVQQKTSELRNKLLELQIFPNNEQGFINNQGNVVANEFYSAHPFDSSINRYESLNDFLNDYIRNEIIYKNEIRKALRGGTDFFATYEKFSKRMGLATTPGLKLVTQGPRATDENGNIQPWEISEDWGLPETINEIVFADLFNKNEYQQIYDYMKEKGFDFAEEYASGAINKTDAQGFMSIDGYRDYMQGMGMWEQNHEDAYNNYKKKGKFVDNNGVRPKIKPIKPYYEAMARHGVKGQHIMAPVAIKNSYMPLLKEFTQDQGTPLNRFDDLRKRMEAVEEYEGQEPIHWANSERARKISVNGIHDLNNDNLSDVHINKLPSENMRIPQVKPDKDTDRMLLGSQLTRLIMSSLPEHITPSYNLSTGDYDRQQLQERYHGVVNQMVNLEMQKLKNDLGYQDYINAVNSLNAIKDFTISRRTEHPAYKDHMDAMNRLEESVQHFKISPTNNFEAYVDNFSKNMLSKLRDMLVESAKNSNRPMTSEQRKALDIVERQRSSEFRLPLSFPAFARKNEQVLFSIFRNRLMRQEVLGKQAVQFAELGNVVYDGNEHNLQYKESDDGGVEAEIIISRDIAKLFGLNEGESVANVPKEVRTLIGYRIPTQGKNSMITFRVKRVVDNYDSTIVVPGVITKQMGSDFDIDSMFLMAYHTKKDRNGNLQRVKPKKNIESMNRKELENSLLEIVENILTHPDHAEEVMRPLDADTLHKVAERINEGDLNPNDPSTEVELQIRNRDGKSGIGIYANALMGYVTSQHMGVTVNDARAVKIKDGDRDVMLSSLSPITDIQGNSIEYNISQHMSIALDNANDPIMGKINDNSFTSPVTVFMIASGLPIDQIANFRINEDIRNLSNEYLNRGYTPGRLKDLMNEILDSKGEALIDERNISTKSMNYENLENESTKDLFENFYQFHKAGSDLITLNKVITPNTLSSDQMNQNAAIEEFKGNEIYIENEQETFNLPDDGSIQALDEYYPLNKGFRESINEAVNFSNIFFPYNYQSVVNLKSNIMSATGNTSFNKALHNAANEFLFNYMISQADNSNMSDIFTTERIEELLYNPQTNIVEKLRDAIKEDPSIQNNAFISALGIHRENKDSQLKRLSFLNTYDYTSTEFEILSNGLKKLYDSDQHHQLAVDLMHYSIFTTGFSPTADSFMTVIPVEMWESEGLHKVFNEQQKILRQDLNQDEYASYVDDFIRHNVERKGLLRSLRLEEGQHRRDEVTIKYDNAKSQGLMSAPKDTPIQYVKAYNKDSKSYDLWTYDSHTFLDGSHAVTYRKTSKKGLPYKLTEANLSKNESDQVFSVEPSNMIPEGHDGNPLYIVPPNISQKQKISRVPDKGVPADKLKETFENAGIDITVNIDDSIDTLGQVNIEDGEITITMKNENLRGADTDIHEFGHVYIEMLGYDSDLVQQGINQLRDTELWNEISELYSDLSERDLHMEILATAIGEEGARLRQDPWWKAWWNRMLNKLKDFFGIERSVANQLAQDMLNNDLQINENKFLSDRLFFHRDAKKIENSNEMIKDMIINLQQQKHTVQQLIRDSKRVTRIEQLQRRLTRIERDLNTAADLQSGMMAFIEHAHRDAAGVKQFVDKLSSPDYHTDTIMSDISVALETIKQLEVLETLERDLKNNDILTEDFADLEQYSKMLRSSIELYNKAKRDIINIAPAKMATELLPAINENAVESVNEMIENTKETGNLPNISKLKKKTEYKTLKSELDNNIIDQKEFDDQVMSMQVEYLQSRIPDHAMLTKLLKEAMNENYALWMVDPVAFSDDQSIKLFNVLVKDALRDAHREVIGNEDNVGDRNVLEKAYKKFTEKTGRKGWNVDKANEPFLERVPTRKRQPDGNYKTVNTLQLVQPYDTSTFYERKYKEMERLRKEYDMPKDYQKMAEWKEENPRKFKQYLSDIGAWKNENMSPVEGWKDIIQEKTNQRFQIEEDIRNLEEQLEQLPPNDQQKVGNRILELRDELDQVMDWLDRNTMDGKTPRGELLRPSTGELGKPDYSSKKYERIQNDPAFKEYYDAMTKYFRETQERFGLHNFTTNEWDDYSYRLPSIRKENLDRLMENGLVDLAKEQWNQLSVLETDDVYGEIDRDAMNTVPVFFNTAVDANEISSDIMKSLLIFGKESRRYDHLTDLLGHVNVMRTILENRRVPKTDHNGNKILDGFASAVGYTRDASPKSATDSPHYKQFEYYIQNNFYGISDDKTTFSVPFTDKNIEANKAVNTLNKWSAFNVFPGNTLQGLANVLLGNTLIWEEAFAGEFFGQRDYLSAKKTYMQNIPSIINDLGRTSPVSKLGQLIERLDAQEGMAMQNIGKSVFNNRLKNMSRADQAFFLQSSGELQLAVTPMLAMMENFTVRDKNGNVIKDDNGNEMNLWDAYTIDTDGNVTLDSRVANFDKKAQNKFMNRLNALNRSMQGIYDRFNRTWLESQWYGKALLLFRSWLFPNFRRYWGYNSGEMNIDHEMGSVREGIFPSTFKLLNRFFTDTATKFSTDAYKHMNKVERRNLKKALIHFGMYFVAMGTVAALRPGEDEEDVARSRYYALYYSRRLQAELGFFFRPLDEGQKILRSPAANIMIITKIRRFANQLGTDMPALVGLDELEPYERQTGIREKGDSKLRWRAADLVPILNNIHKAQAPDESFKWFDNLFM